MLPKIFKNRFLELLKKNCPHWSDEQAILVLVRQVEIELNMFLLVDDIRNHHLEECMFYVQWQHYADPKTELNLPTFAINLAKFLARLIKRCQVIREFDEDFEKIIQNDGHTFDGNGHMNHHIVACFQAVNNYISIEHEQSVNNFIDPEYLRDSIKFDVVDTTTGEKFKDLKELIRHLEYWSDMFLGLLSLRDRWYQNNFHSIPDSGWSTD